MSVSTDFKDKLNDVVLSYYVKCFIQDDNQTWVDFSDDAEIDGVKRFISSGPIEHIIEKKLGTFFVRATKVVMDNYDRFWDAPFPTMKNILGTTASWAQSKNGQQTILKNHKIKLDLHLTLRDGTQESGPLGTFIIEDYATDYTSGRCTLRLNSLAKPLMEVDATNVRDGIGWWRNRSVQFLLKELLAYADKDSHVSVPTAYSLPDNVDLLSTDGVRTLSELGRPPEKMSDGTWIESTAVCRAMLWANITIDSSAVNRLVLGCDEDLFYYNPSVDEYTEIADGATTLGSGYHVRRLWENTNYATNAKRIWGVAWQDPAASDSSESQTVKVFSIDFSGTPAITLEATIAGVHVATECLRPGYDAGTEIFIGQTTAGGPEGGENLCIPFRQTISALTTDVPATSAQLLAPQTAAQNTISANMPVTAWIDFPKDAFLEVDPGYYTAYYENAGGITNIELRFDIGAEGAATFVSENSWKTKGFVAYINRSGVLDYNLAIYDINADAVEAIASWDNMTDHEGLALQVTSIGAYNTGSGRLFVGTIAWDETNTTDPSHGALYEVCADDPVGSEPGDAIVSININSGTAATNRITLDDLGEKAKIKVGDFLYIHDGVSGPERVRVTSISTAPDTYVTVDSLANDYGAHADGVKVVTRMRWRGVSGTDQYAVVLEVLHSNGTGSIADIAGIMLYRDKIFTQAAYGIFTLSGDLTSETAGEFSHNDVLSGPYPYKAATLDKTSAKDMFFVEQGTGKLWKYDVSAGVSQTNPLAVADGEPFASEDLFTNVHKLAVDDDTRSTDIIYGTSAPFFRGETQSSAPEGRFILWKFDTYLNGRVPLAEFKGMNVWEVIEKFAQAYNYIAGFDVDGKFFFVPRPTTGSADYTLKNDADADRILQINKSSGFDQIYNHVEVVPYELKLEEPTGEVRPIDSSRNTWQFSYRQKDHIGKTIKLICVREGRILNGRESKLRFKYIVYTLPINSVLVGAYGSADVTISLYSVFGGDSDASGIRIGDFVSAYNPSNNIPVVRRIDGVNSSTNVITIDSAMGFAMSVGTVIEITKRNTFEGSPTSSEWSDEGITYLAEDMTATEWEGVALNSVRNLSIGTIIRIDDDEMEIVSINETAKEVDFRRGAGGGSDNRFGIGDTTPVTHSTGDVLKAYFLPVTYGDSGYLPELEVGDSNVFLRLIERDRFRRLSGIITDNVTDIDLELDTVSGIVVGDVIRVEGAGHDGTTEDMLVVAIPNTGGEEVTVKRQYNQSSLTAFAEGDYARIDRPFRVGDHIIIECPGVTLIENRHSVAPASDPTSNSNYGRREYPKVDNKFIYHSLAKHVSRSILNNYSNPHYIVTVDAIFLPWITFVEKSSTPRAFRVAVQNEFMFPRGNIEYDTDTYLPYSMIGYPVQVIHDPMNCKTKFVIRSYEPY